MARETRGRGFGPAGLSRWLACLSALLVVGGFATRASGSTGSYPYYWLTLLGTLPGYSSAVPVAVNARGEVACQTRGGTLPVRSFLWSGGNRTDLGTFGEGGALAYDLDDQGRIVGAGVPPAGAPAPFLWEAGQFQPLPLLPGYAGGEARAIGNDGRIAGDLIDPQGGHHACLWADGAVSLLPEAPGRPYSHAQGINNVGQVVGATFAVSPARADQGRAALWRDGEVVDLGVKPGYSGSEANAVNDAGDVVGEFVEGSRYRAGFRWRAGELRDLGGLNAMVVANNNPGQAVGTALEYIGHGSYRTVARWWRADGQGISLTERFSSDEYLYDLDAATAINDAGQVAGFAPYDGAFLLTPVCADVQLTLTASTGSPQVGQPFTLTLTLRNLGPDPAYNPYYNLEATPGLEFLSSSATAGSAWVYGDSAGGHLPDLAPGDPATVTLTAVAHSAGALSVVATRQLSNDAATGRRTQVALTVTGTPLPDLEPQWNWVQTHRFPGRPHSERTVSGALKVTNWGTAPAPHPRVRFYLMLPGALERKVLLQTLRLDTLDPGEYTYRYLGARLPLDLGPVRGRVLAVVDEPDLIPESIETNNTTLSEELKEETN